MGIPPHALQSFAWVLATFWGLVGEGEQKERAAGHGMAFGHRGRPWEAGPTAAVEKIGRREDGFQSAQVTHPTKPCVLPGVCLCVVPSGPLTPRRRCRAQLIF